MSILGPILLTIQVLYAILGLTEGNSHKIVGGFEVFPKYKYSYMAYFFSYRNKCGATIINENHALTAAHCIKTHRPTRKHFLIVGHHRINRIDAIGPNPELVFGSDYIIRVKEFIFRRDGKDIAILRLERSIVFNSRVGPACLPSLPAPSYANMEAVATGWGGTVGYDPGQYVDQNSSLNLREVTLNVVPPNSRLCTKAVSDQEAHLCTYKLGKDTCQGDSGGPLAIRQDGVFVVIGVVHAGSGCGAQDYASIYTRVSYFVNWIKENVGQVCTPGVSGESSHSHSYSQTSQSETSTNNAGPVEAPLEQVTAPPFPIITAPPVESNAGCRCSNFVNKNGFGLCRKPDSDFGGSVSCYVMVPSSCPDLIRSGSNPDKFLSAEACRLKRRTENLGS